MSIKKAIDMSYTEAMWEKFRDTVLKMYGQGYMPFEIARVLESSEELIVATIERYHGQETHHSD